MIAEIHRLTPVIEEFLHLRNIYGDVPIFIESSREAGDLKSIVSFTMRENTKDILSPDTNYGTTCIINIL